MMIHLTQHNFTFVMPHNLTCKNLW